MIAAARKLACLAGLPVLSYVSVRCFQNQPLNPPAQPYIFVFLCAKSRTSSTNHIPAVKRLPTRFTLNNLWTIKSFSNSAFSVSSWIPCSTSCAALATCSHAHRWCYTRVIRPHTKWKALKTSELSMLMEAFFIYCYLIRSIQVLIYPEAPWCHFTPLHTRFLWNNLCVQTLCLCTAFLVLSSWSWIFFFLFFLIHPFVWLTFVFPSTLELK